MSQKQNVKQLLTLKADHKQHLTINKIDIVGLVNVAWWETSFFENNIATSKKGTSEQVWFPTMSYNALLYPEIQFTQPQQKIRG